MKIKEGPQKATINVAVKEVKADNRYMTMIGSSEILDRDQEAFDTAGWDLKNYKKNPVILFGHDKRQPPVAKSNKTYIDGKELIFEIEFPEDGVYPFADTVRKLYAGGFMRASSVGFIPKKWEFGDGKPDRPRVKYLEQELLELSLVPVPSNPAALVTAKELREAWDKNAITTDEMTLFCEKVMSFVRPADKDAGCELTEFEKMIGDLTKAFEEFKADVEKRFGDLMKADEATAKRFVEFEAKFKELGNGSYVDLLLKDRRRDGDEAPEADSPAAKLGIALRSMKTGEL